jgi:hypothetical protein
MAYIDQATLAQDGTFRNRVLIAMVQQAMNVQGETQGSQSDAVYGKRQDFSGRILLDPNGSPLLDMFVLGILSFDTAITAGITDAQLQTRVSQAFNRLARITAKD